MLRDALQGVQGSHGTAHKREESQAYDRRVQFHGVYDISDHLSNAKAQALQTLRPPY